MLLVALGCPALPAPTLGVWGGGSPAALGPGEGFFGRR